ncbi:MAG: HEPN domain-containing protein [Candidatus Solibacter sp.]|jgi:HEPN domain-containing protein
MNVPPEVVEVLQQWVRKAEHVPRTHDLKALAALVPSEHRFPMRVEDLAGLNPYAVDVRYADEWREPQLNDAKRALELASKVRAAVRELMPPPVVD